MNELIIKDVTSKEAPGEALIQVCLYSFIVFLIETLPIKAALNKDFIKLFCKPKEPLKETNNKEIIVNVSDASSGVRIETQVAETARLSFTEYASRNVSISTITKLIKSDLLSSSDVKLKALYSSNKKKLGAIYKAEATPSKGDVQLAARTFTLNKIPSYLVESIYLEMAYNKENRYKSLVPILGLVCEPPTLTFLTPWYKLSLNQFIYQNEITDKEKLKAILYNYYLNP
jgi:hypothetical protein